MAKTDVWMPLYIGDYMADTMHLTTEQHGAYLLLIMAYWRKGGPLSSNDTALASIARMSIDAWSNAKAMLEEFFDTSSGTTWAHHRIEKEMTEAGQKKAKQVERAKKAAESRWNNAPSIAPSNRQAMHKECPSPSPSPSDKPKYKYLPDDLAIAELINEKVLLITGSIKKPNLESWADTIRLIRESDRRSHDEIRTVFLWANQDGFWKANILSPAALRKQFDKLLAKRNQEQSYGQAGQSNSGHQQRDNSAAGRVAANIARERAQRKAVATGFDREPLVVNGSNVRPQVDQQLRGSSGSGERLGSVLEGDFCRAD